jgi:myo-inositol catabolism protein IolC
MIRADDAVTEILRQSCDIGSRPDGSRIEVEVSPAAWGLPREMTKTDGPFYLGVISLGFDDSVENLVAPFRTATLTTSSRRCLYIRTIVGASARSQPSGTMMPNAGGVTKPVRPFKQFVEACRSRESLWTA